MVDNRRTWWQRALLSLANWTDTADASIPVPSHSMFTAAGMLGFLLCFDASTEFLYRGKEPGLLTAKGRKG